MNQIIPHLDAAEHFGNNCAFWNCRDDWFLQRDQVKVHLFNGSLRLVDITHAMKPGKVCDEFCFNWNWHEGTPPGLHRLLKRHGYNLRSLFNELLALDWQPAKHWKTGEPLGYGWQTFNLPEIIVHLPDFGELGESFGPGCSLELHRTDLRSSRIWSPFATVHPLKEKPAKWTVPHVVRALLSGQFSNLKCDGKYSDDYAYDNAVNFHIGEFGQREGAAVAFARRIIESPSGWWAYDRDDSGRVSICCHHFDSNSFKFELMKRFNPAAQGGAGVPPAATEPTEAEPEKQNRKSAIVNRKSAAPVGQITLTINDARQLVELRFPGKPDEDVRAEMKAARFRWYGPAGCWYHKHTPENLAWAQEFIARQVGRVTPCAPSEPAAMVAARQLPPVAVVTPEVAVAFGMEKLPNVRILPQFEPTPVVFKSSIVNRKSEIPKWRQRFAH